MPNSSAITAAVAPALFAVGTTQVEGFAQKLASAEIIPENYQKTASLDIAVGLSLKGFILKAEEMGIGTCILTGPLTFITNIEDVLDSNDIDVKCFLAAGYPDEAPAPVEKSKIEEIYREI